MRKLGKRRRKTHLVIPKNGFRGPAVHSPSHFGFFRGLYGPVPRLFLTGRINYLVCTFTSFHSFLHHQKRRILLLHLKKEKKKWEKNKIEWLVARKWHQGRTNCFSFLLRGSDVL
jgi:hypothetical protein